jgi:hypothetical protein
MRRKGESKATVESELKEAATTYVHSTVSGMGHAPQAVEDQGWVDFRDQCRRQMNRPIELRIKYGFCRMYKPVLDDAPGRAFDTMAEYRAWCEKNLPAYLGFKRPTA